MTGPSAYDLLSAFENAPIGMAVLTPLGVVTACNAAVGALLHRRVDELIGGTFFDVTHPDDLPGALVMCGRLRDGGPKVVRHECRFVRPDGETVWVMVSTSRVPDGPAREAHLIMHIEDVTDRKTLETELSHRALHDPLTGLGNRTLLIERLGEALRLGRPSHVFYLDLDGFKSVNDRFGHAAGDQLLIELGRRISGLLGPADTAARLGGDEFVVLCTAAGPDHADVLAQRLAGAVAEPFLVDGHRVAVSAAVGRSTTRPGDPTLDADVVLREADRSMYAGKRRRLSDARG